jgi:hypothetical protein
MTRRFRSRLDDEGGFTLAVAMGIMLIASIITIAAFQAATGDLVGSGDDHDRKVAYAAAESGISWYQTKLSADPDFWRKCAASASATSPVHQPNASTRYWKKVSGTGASVADFTITLKPITATCSTTDPYSMLNSANGTFQIRSTGRYHGEIRTIVATFRRTRFLDFLYFTNYETLDTIIYPAGDSRLTQCKAYRAARSGKNCTEISFITADKVNGPLHTNDNLLHCGSPTFGRSSGVTTQDKIEVSGPAPGYFNNGCSGSPVFNGPFRSAQPALQLPPSNAELESLALPGYRFDGTVYIRFIGGGRMVVDLPGTGTGKDPYQMDLPPNGVLYASDAGCSNPSSPDDTIYDDGSLCGDIYVSGTVDQPITLGSARDIIVAPTSSSTSTSNQFNPQTATGTSQSLTQDGAVSATHKISGTTQVGLIANRYVRVYHRIDSSGNIAGGARTVRIDAAVLSLQNSFIVDNWNRGGSPNPAVSLTVNGAIAQFFRGPVGTNSGGVVNNGFAKDYWYDDRLKYASPPYFLDPVNSAWSVGRETELVPAAL